MENDNLRSLIRYDWSNKNDLLKLLDSKEFLEFVEDAYNDLVKYYNLTNSFNGVVTPTAINTAIAYSGGVRHEITMMYEVLKELEERDLDAFDDFKARTEIAIRKRENRSDLAGAKWLAQTEIAKYAKIENYEEYSEYRRNYKDSHNKCRFVLRLLENLKIRSEDLKTISSNARTEMNNLNIDALCMTLEEQALQEITQKRVAIEADERRRSGRRRQPPA